MNDLIEEVIEPNKLAFDGAVTSWEGLICLQEIGKCTEEHQAIVRKWLEDRGLADVRTSELLTSGGTKFDKGRQLPTRFVLREFYDAQNAAGGGAVRYRSVRARGLPVASRRVTT